MGELEELGKNIVNEGCSEQDTHDNGERQHQAVSLVNLPKSLELLTMVLLHHNGPQERRHGENGEDADHGVGNLF